VGAWGRNEPSIVNNKKIKIKKKEKKRNHALLYT
jgi:hypothetical protein